PAEDSPDPDLPPQALRWALLGLATLLVPWLVRGKSTRLFLLGLLLLSFAWPSLPLGDPARIELDDEADFDRDGDVSAAIREAAGQFADGGIVVAPCRGPLPLERATLLGELRSRKVALECQESLGNDPLLWPDARRVVPGTPISFTVEPVSLRGRIVALGPGGKEETVAITSPSHVPTVPGLWQYRLENAFGRVVAGVRVTVEEGIPTWVLQGNPPSGASQVVQDPAFLRTGSGLPPHPERSLVVLDGFHPADWSDEAFQKLRNWLRAGGTLFSVAAPPFFPESEQKQHLEKILPAALPPPPRREERSLGIVLLDLSGSLAGEGLRELARGIQTLLEETPRGARWGIGGFKDKPFWLALPNTPLDTEQMQRVLEGLAASGGTRLDRALDFVLQEFAREETGRSLIILSDGRSLPADWQRYGERLAAAQVELQIIGVGHSVHRPLLETLAYAAGGDFVVATSAEHAASLLSDSIAMPEGPWREVFGELRVAGLHPLLSAVPRRLPRPLRRLSVTLEQGTETLLVDATGAPLLVQRSVGEGRTLLWLSGLGQDSLPDGAAGERILSALASVLVSATRESPVPERKLQLRVDRRGQKWLSIERLPGEPLVTAVAVSKQQRHAAARETWAYALELSSEQTSAVRVTWKDGTELALAPGPTRQAHAWHELAQSTAAFAPQRGAFPIDILLALVAMLTGVGSRRRYSLGFS
ncbi:MAG: vWA domain-containing protein, partial [Planctomycetota bacterium]